MRRRDRKVRIERGTVTGRDDFNHPIRAPQVIATLSAGIEDMSDGERTEAGLALSVRAAKAKVRASAKAQGIRAGDHLVELAGLARWKITGLHRDPDGRRAHLVLTLTRVSEEG